MVHIFGMETIRNYKKKAKKLVFLGHFFVILQSTFLASSSFLFKVPYRQTEL